MVLRAYTCSFASLVRLRWFVVSRTYSRHSDAVDEPVLDVSLHKEAFASCPSWHPSIPPPPRSPDDKFARSVIPWSDYTSGLGGKGKPLSFHLVDTRKYDEYLRDHIPGAIHIQTLPTATVTSPEGAVQDSYDASSVFPSQVDCLFYCSSDSKWSRRRATASLVTQTHRLDGGNRPAGRFACLLGGYESWRRLIVRQLDAWPRWRMPGTFWVISGLTGSGKSLVLEELASAGESVIDLEAMAEHKGSMFGASADRYPSLSPVNQRQFEGRLHSLLMDGCWSGPIWIECESRLVGPAVQLCDGLWRRLRDDDDDNGGCLPNVSPTVRVWLTVSQEARVDWILQQYSNFTADQMALDAILSRLSRYHSDRRVSQWRQWASAGDFSSLVTGLLQHHYDPLYRQSRAGVLASAARRGRLLDLVLPSAVDRHQLRSHVLPRLFDWSESDLQSRGLRRRLRG